VVELESMDECMCSRRRDYISKVSDGLWGDWKTHIFSSFVYTRTYERSESGSDAVPPLSEVSYPLSLLS